MKRGIALEISRLTGAEERRFCDMHELGAKLWSGRWLGANELVLMGAEASGMVTMSARQPMKLIYSSIAFRTCLNRWPKTIGEIAAARELLRSAGMEG